METLFNVPGPVCYTVPCIVRRDTVCCKARVVANPHGLGTTFFSVCALKQQRPVNLLAGLSMPLRFGIVIHEPNTLEEDEYSDRSQ